MTRSSPREIGRRLADLEQDNAPAPEFDVTITRHTVESFNANESEYDLETVSESELLTVREAIVDE